MSHYQLSATLAGHELDVKAVRGPTEDLIISSSRDKTVRMWSRTSSNDFGESKVFLGHTQFVNSVAYLRPTAEHPDGLIISGGSDKNINVFDVNKSQDPVYTLIGHKDNVCTLDITPSGFIVSGSWDKTAKIWKNWQEYYTLEGHTLAVWAVLAVDDDFILTGSADKSIIKWQKGKRVQTLDGHTDCVRALALLPNSGFASCGNDSTIRIWSFSGQCVRELSGHTSFVYSLGVLPTGEIISSGEDRSVRIWKAGECTQTILLPATSVWCVDAMPNGDIISCSSDGLIRVFTRSPERVSEPTVLKDFEDQVSNHAISANQVGDLKKDELPGQEALLVPGKKEGQVIMIRVRDAVEAHQWSQKDNMWHKVGEVVDAVGQGRKQLYNGKEYDYVFDVDIGDGVPPLKLPYNATDNPYQAAQQFIWANELPQSYLDQVADFITRNARGVSLGSESQYVDPFTGPSRYTPGSSTNNPSHHSSSTVPNAFATGIDPWTRPSPSPSPSSSSNTSESNRVIPQRTYLTFRQANYQAILKKINQLNKDLQESDPTDDGVLTHEELNALENLTTFLQNPSSKSSSTADRRSEFIVVYKIVCRWPPASRFPGIDLLRLLVLYSPIPAQHEDIDGNIINLLIDFADIKSWVEGTSPIKEQETNTMLGLRALANLFDTKEGREVLRRKAPTIVELISPILKQTTNKNLRVALVTVFLNFSVEFRTNPDEDAILQIVAILAEILESETDSEVLYRSIVTLGTAISHNPAAKEAAELFGVKKSVKLASTKVAEARINQVAGELNKLI